MSSHIAYLQAQDIKDYRILKGFTEINEDIVSPTMELI